MKFKPKQSNPEYQELYNRDIRNVRSPSFKYVAGGAAALALATTLGPLLIYCLSYVYYNRNNLNPSVPVIEKVIERASGPDGRLTTPKSRTLLNKLHIKHQLLNEGDLAELHASNGQTIEAGIMKQDGTYQIIGDPDKPLTKTDLEEYLIRN